MFRCFLWDSAHLTASFNRFIADYTLRAIDPTLIRQGDFDGDGLLTANDIDALSAAARDSTTDLGFDLDFDGEVNQTDLRRWVTELKRIYYGDTDLDGEFNSQDLVQVFQAAQYEDGRRMNSSWSTGDWDGSGDLDSQDLI